MRVTGGTARGLILKVPKNYDIRPTTDRIREAIFSMLISIGGDWTRCLDLFAGTGALGIEALSRGAGWVDFIEKHPRCCDIIKQNLKTVGFSQQSHVYCMNVVKALGNIEGEYNIIFMDPPYADKSQEDVINQINEAKFIVINTLLVIPHSSRVELAGDYGNLRLIKDRKHGDTCISIYRKETDN
jgi:16S rRNA (guanine(966)-N(2))-methyltransferase RsmD